MLSYQHSYHAGCLADVHKHALLALVLDKMVQKEKPLTYIETHAGRGLYNLQDNYSQKTQEYKTGIEQYLKEKPFLADHPFNRVLRHIHTENGGMFYPGSPMVASRLLRASDRLYLMELHPQEVVFLRQNMAQRNITIYHEDGYKKALSLSPPDPKRGIIMIDPSYEIKKEYDEVATFIQKIHRKWPVAVIALWYPILKENRHQSMIKVIQQLDLPKTIWHEVDFRKKQQTHHAMAGSGMFFANIPFGLDHDFKQVAEYFQ